MRRIALAGSLGVVVGCYEGSSGSTGGVDSDGADAGSESGSGGDPTGEDPPPLGCDGEAFDPGPTPLRRLTHAEYAAAVRDVLGVDVSERASSFPADVTTGSFDNDAANQTISVLLGEAYLGAAQQIAGDVVSTPERRDALVGCDLASGDDCLRSFAATLGRRLWRRPLSEAEIEAFVELASANAETVDEKASIVVEAFLMSPKFLFRAERGVADPDAPGLLRLDGFEVATRLSFFLWGSTPDDALLDAAQAGELDTRDGVAAHAQRMLEDDRARAAMTAFSEQWFRVAGMETQYRDPEAFPEWNEGLAVSMREELRLLLDDFMWGDADFLGLLTADHGYVDDNLAAIYDVPAGNVDWSNDPQRGGFFTTAAFATASSRAGDTSPVTRAVYVREIVLCDPPPAPPPDVPLIEPQEGESTQDAFERHTADPACAGCHLTIDPIGHGLERYDSIGRMRAEYDDGTPVRLEGSVVIDGDVHEFAGGKQLGALVADSEAAERCVVAHAHRFAMGRHEGETDACTLDRATLAFTESGHAFEAMLLDLVRSDAFRYRRDEP
jgi:hypothetical protein